MKTVLVEKRKNKIFKNKKIFFVAFTIRSRFAVKILKEYLNFSAQFLAFMVKIPWGVMKYNTSLHP